MLPVKAVLAVFILLFGLELAVGEDSAKDWIPAVTFPNVALSTSLHPTERSFRNGTFIEVRYEPLGSVEIELTGFHRVSEVGATFGIAEYRKTSTGGSSSNDCFVQLVSFKGGLKPWLVQQIRFGCDPPGSGSMVSADGNELTIKEGYKGDSSLIVVRFRRKGQKFSITTRTSEPVT